MQSSRGEIGEEATQLLETTEIVAKYTGNKNKRKGDDGQIQDCLHTENKKNLPSNGKKVTVLTDVQWARYPKQFSTNGTSVDHACLNFRVSSSQQEDHQAQMTTGQTRSVDMLI